MIYTMCNHMNESLIRKNVCSQTFLTNRFRVSFACNLEYIYTARSGVTDMGLSKSFMFCVGGILGIVQESYGYQFPLICSVRFVDPMRVMICPLLAFVCSCV